VKIAYTNIKKDSNDQAGRIASVLKEIKEVVNNLAMHSKRQKAVLDQSTEEYKPKYARLDALLH
jgi:hypothetical protein